MMKPNSAAPINAPTKAPTIPPQKRSGSQIVKCQSARPIITQASMPISDASRAGDCALRDFDAPLRLWSPERRPRSRRCRAPAPAARRHRRSGAASPACGVVRLLPRRRGCSVRPVRRAGLGAAARALSRAGALGVGRVRARLVSVEVWRDGLALDLESRASSARTRPRETASGSGVVSRPRAARALGPRLDVGRRCPRRRGRSPARPRSGRRRARYEARAPSSA